MSSNTNINEYLSNVDENFQSYMIIGFAFIILIIFILYLMYLSNLRSSECSYMNSLYPSVDGYIQPISSSDSDFSGNLYDYYIKTAYNACSGGSYKNDFVDLCNLKAIIKQGIRCLDFEIYSIDNQPVVSTSTDDDYNIKETFNSVKFSDVMSTIRNYAFSGGTCPNSTDPLLIHLRCKSNNQSMYSNLVTIFNANSDLMLGMNYSYESDGKNLGSVPLLQLQNKIVLIMDRSNTAFLENQALLEYVNLTSNSMFMREYAYYDVQNNPDINELTEYNRKNLTIVVPDTGTNPPNPNGIVCRASGCQMVAMRYQFVDNYLMENAEFFDRGGYAFVLKPDDLRYHPVTVAAPTEQNPDYSYATRNVSSDYYNFKM